MHFLLYHHVLPPGRHCHIYPNQLDISEAAKHRPAFQVKDCFLLQVHWQDCEISEDGGKGFFCRLLVFLQVTGLWIRTIHAVSSSVFKRSMSSQKLSQILYFFYTDAFTVVTNLYASLNLRSCKTVFRDNFSSYCDFSSMSLLSLFISERTKKL